VGSGAGPSVLMVRGWCWALVAVGAICGWCVVMVASSSCLGVVILSHGVVLLSLWCGRCLLWLWLWSVIIVVSHLLSEKTMSFVI